jgi:hypothetical protein
MAGDKKNRGARVHFALAAALGQVHQVDGWTTPVPEDAIRQALAGLSE